MRRPDAQCKNRNHAGSLITRRSLSEPSLEAAILRALDASGLEIQAQGLGAQIDAAAKHVETLITHDSRTIQDHDTSEREFSQAHQQLLEQHSSLLEQIHKNDHKAACHYCEQEIVRLGPIASDIPPYLRVTLLESAKSASDESLEFIFQKS